MERTCEKKNEERKDEEKTDGKQDQGQGRTAAPYLVSSWGFVQ